MSRELGLANAPEIVHKRISPYVQSFPPLYEIEICSGLCAKASATCWYQVEGRQEEKDAPVPPQRLLHNSHRHAQLRLRISK